MNRSDCDNVCKEIVEKNLCIGCGVCAGICPNNNLKMVSDEFGGYVVCDQGQKCPDNCRICLKVCPFSDKSANEDALGKQLYANVPNIKHSPETGYYLESYVGYTSTESGRANSASGGYATLILENLLKDKYVDYVVCVCSTNDSENLFEFTVIDSVDNVRNCSGSCYYPVEMEGVIEHILGNEGRYAIIGLPCFCKALQSAIIAYPKLRKRIAYVLGLVCGQSKTKFFAEYVCAFAGGSPHSISKFKFRVKEMDKPASNFAMSFSCKLEKGLIKEGKINNNDGISELWNERFFTPNACNFCDDVFAECADIAFMDAWLQEYSSDPKGHSIALVRKKEILDILEKLSTKGLLVTNHLGIDQVIRSQSGVLNSKRSDIATRFHYAKRNNIAVPVKRDHLFNRINFLRKPFIRNQLIVSLESSKKWAEVNKNLSEFMREFQPLCKRLDRTRKIDKYEKILNRIVRRLKRMVR